MSSGTGLDAILGVAAESVYSTFHAPDRHILFNSEDFNYAVPRIESPGIGDGARVERSDQWTTGRRQGTGTLTFDMPNKGSGLFLHYMLGDIATAADGAGKKHTATVGNMFGESLSFQVGRPGTDGGIECYSYSGGKITAWRFTQAVEGFLSVSLTVDLCKELTDQTLTTGDPPSPIELFAWKTLLVTVDGTQFDPTDVELGGENPMKTDRFFLNACDTKKEPLENAKRRFTGSLTGEFENSAQYQRFLDADPGIPDSMVPIVFTWTGVSEYDSGKPYKLVVTFPSCRFDGTTPNVGGPDVIMQPAPFVALANGTDEPCTMELFTSDATP